MILSTAMHQFPPTGFTPLPSSSNLMSPIDHHHQSPLHHHQQSQLQNKQMKSRHHPYGQSNGHVGMSPTMSQSQSGTAPGPIRRRISRACDQCNQLRTKCDGKLPCQHCVDFQLKCEYARERKKRGKASRKDIQAAAAAAAAAAQNGGGGGGMSVSGSSVSASPTSSVGPINSLNSRGELPPPPRPGVARKGSQTSTRSSISELHDLSQVHHHHLPGQHHHHLPAPESPSHLHFQQQDVNGGMHMQMDSHRNSYSHPSPQILNPPRMLPQMNGHIQTQNLNGNGGYGNEFAMMSPHQQSHHMTLPSSAASPLTGLLGHAPEQTEQSWLSFPSPPAQMASSAGLRYPVLLPLLPHLGSIIATPHACDLLDLYFISPSTAFLQPQSPYVLTHIFRKRSFLHPTNPRLTSPALLCAMLWVAAQTCDAPFLTSNPTARGRICQRLLELCINLLKPLVHVNISTPMAAPNPVEGETGGVGLGGLGGVPGSGREGVGAAGTLDDVLTYLHLGTVISASEFKAASLRWFHAAWTLSRELRLNREVPVDIDLGRQDDEGGHPSPTDTGPGSVNAPTGMSEEEREERRRTWWLLYIIDRHLALCYNRPLALLDIECEGLYLPINEAAWQNGDFFQEAHNGMYQTGTINRQTGPIFEISGPGLFEFFLPLMNILGMIVDLHHARNRPRFGAMMNSGSDIWEDVVSEITGHLDTYSNSLKAYEEAASQQIKQDPTSPGGANNESNGQNGQQSPEVDMQTRIVLSYGTHVMHVLYILLQGKWDPISMLDDTDLWISSNSFISATAHAVSAAEAISNILKYDPDLSFMPYFFGIYLLQGSFLLLLIADKLQSEVSQAVVTACETIVRAHEVCVVTLNTEYQRNFRKVMRSALSQVRGRGLPEDMEDQKLKRREVLALYRWCGDGTGLAL